jgi:hypothetical protein
MTNGVFESDFLARKASRNSSSVASIFSYISPFRTHNQYYRLWKLQ